MTEEELEWFEENWSIGKNGRDAVRNNREFKSFGSIWIDWGERARYYRKDNHCWKTKRKNHYKPCKIKKDKKRKSPEREHWRYKINYSYRRPLWDFDLKSYQEARKRIQEEKARQYYHIQELKKVGEWVPKWKYDSSYNRYDRTFVYFKQDLNDPFDHGKYYEHYDRHGRNYTNKY